MGYMVLFCEIKNMNASIFIIYRHDHFVAYWMYFQSIEVSDSKNKKILKKIPFFAKDKSPPLKLHEEITIFPRIEHFYETPIFFDQFPKAQWSNKFTWIHVIHNQKKILWRLSEKIRISQKWEKNVIFWKNCRMIVIIRNLGPC